MTRCVCVVAIAAFLGGLACILWSEILVHHHHRRRHFPIDAHNNNTPAECCWVDLRIEWQLREAPKLCARCTTNDALSNVLRAEGKWQNCDDLLVLLRGHPPEGGGLFVDVGANLGACTMLVAGQGFETHAFEPQPDHLRASLARLPPSLVHLHAFALGEVRTLDAEFPTVKPNILLMRLDVWGSEVKVLRGARRLLAAGAIAAIQTELAPAFGEAQQRELCQLLDEAGFTLHHQHPHTRPAISVIVCAHMRGNLYAVRRPLSAAR